MTSLGISGITLGGGILVGFYWQYQGPSTVFPAENVTGMLARDFSAFKLPQPGEAGGDLPIERVGE